MLLFLVVGDLFGKEEDNVILHVVPHVVHKPRHQTNISDFVATRMVDSVDGYLTGVLDMPTVDHRHTTDGT